MAFRCDNCRLSHMDTAILLTAHVSEPMWVCPQCCTILRNLASLDGRLQPHGQRGRYGAHTCHACKYEERELQSVDDAPLLPRSDRVPRRL